MKRSLDKETVTIAVVAILGAVGAGVAAGLGSITYVAAALGVVLAVVLFYYPNLSAGLAVLVSPMPAVIFLLTGDLKIGEFAIVYGIVVALVMIKLAMGQGSISVPRLWLPMLVFLTVTAFAVYRAAPVVSTNPVEIWTSGLARPMLYMSMVFLGIYFGREKKPPRIVTIFAVAVLFYSASMYLQRLGLFELPWSGTIADKRFGGLLITGNGLAAFLAPYVAFLLAFVGTTVRKDRSWTFVALLIGIPSLALTLSRSGLLAFSVAFALWLAFLSKASATRRALIIGLIALEFLAVLLLPQVNSYWAQMSDDYTSGNLNSFTQDRDRIYAGVPKYLADPTRLAIGGGMDDYTYHIKQYTNVVTQYAVHSFWLQTLTDTGIVGLIAVLYLMGATAVYLWRAQRGPPEIGPIARGGLLALVAIAVFNLTGNIALGSMTMGPFWFIIGYVQGRAETIPATQPAEAALNAPASQAAVSDKAPAA